MNNSPLKAQSVSENTSSQKYGVIFCIFLVALSILYRDNATLVYPQIIYLLASLLIFNVGASVVLRMKSVGTWIATAIVLLNCAIITAILNFSGGCDSNLWVLYLLPIYTACLLLNGSELGLVLLGVLCFNGVLYSFTADSMSAPDIFNLSLKGGFFVFASAFTWKIVKKDRRIREKILIQRTEIEAMEHKMKEVEPLVDIGQITSGITHDLGNPLAVIACTVQMLLEDETLSKSLRPDLERIARSVQLCQTITTNVLDMAKVNHMKMMTHDIHDSLKSVITMYRPMLEKSGIRIGIDFAENLPMILGSPSHLQRIFFNFLSNARGAMKDGGTIFVRTKVFTPGGENTPSWVKIVFEDTGPGLSPEAISKIFKPFNTTKEMQGGTGLGLYVSREIVSKHNGFLTAENRPEGGARFIILLPISPTLKSSENPKKESES